MPNGKTKVYTSEKKALWQENKIRNNEKCDWMEYGHHYEGAKQAESICHKRKDDGLNEERNYTIDGHDKANGLGLEA